MPITSMMSGSSWAGAGTTIACASSAIVSRSNNHGRHAVAEILALLPAHCSRRQCRFKWCNWNLAAAGGPKTAREENRLPQSRQRYRPGAGPAYCREARALSLLSFGRGYGSLAACCLAGVGEGLRTLDSPEPLTNFA